MTTTTRIDATRRRRSLLEATWFVRFSQAAAIGGFLGIWQLASTQGWINPIFMGSPEGTFEELEKLASSGQLWDESVATMSALFVALAIGVVPGIVVGLALAQSVYLDRVFSPFLVPLNSLPRLAFAPLFLLWFGLSMWAKVALAVSIIFFIMVFNTRAGVRNVDPDMTMAAKLVGISDRGIVRKVALPFAVPSVLAGFRLSVTYGLLGVVGSEMIAAKDGMGTVIVASANTLNTNAVFAVLITLASIAVVLGTIIDYLERWLLRWQ